MSPAKAPAKAPAKTAAAPHLTPAERAERGKAARREVPRESHADYESTSQASGPDRHHRRPVGEAGAGADPDPVRPDVGVTVPVLPRRGGHHGQRPGHDPADRDPGAAVRGRAHAQLPAARLARTQPDVRHQRLRRDAARPVGVGRQTAVGEPGHRRPAERVHRQGTRHHRAGHRRLLPQRDARLRAPGQPRRLVRQGRRGRHPGRLRQLPDQGRTQEAVGHGRPRRRAGTACRPSRNSPRWWTAAGRSCPTRR